MVKRNLLSVFCRRRDVFLLDLNENCSKNRQTGFNDVCYSCPIVTAFWQKCWHWSKWHLQLMICNLMMIWFYFKWKTQWQQKRCASSQKWLLINELEMSIGHRKCLQKRSLTAINESLHCHQTIQSTLKLVFFLSLSLFLPLLGPTVNYSRCYIPCHLKVLIVSSW